MTVDRESAWRRLWRRVALFAYRRWAPPTFPTPDGVPGIRDRDARCSSYAPRAWRLGDWPCAGAGHYLCEECSHFDGTTDPDLSEE